MSRALRRDVVWLWFGYLGRSLAYLGLTAVLTRILGPEGFGELALFLALTLGVSQVAGSWPFLAVPVLSARKGTIGTAFRPAAAVAALGTLVALLITIPTAIALDIASGVSLGALIVYAAALVALQGAYAVLQTEGAMAGIAMLQTAERFVSLVALIVVAALVSVGPREAELVLALSASAVAIFSLGSMARRRSLSGDGTKPHDARAVLSAVGAMGVVSVASYGVGWVDVFTLSAFRSQSEVGIYTLAYQVFNFVVQLGSLWAVAALPRHAKTSAAGASLRSQLPVDRLAVASELWAGMVGAGALIVALALPSVFGQDFRDAVPPVVILLSGSAFFAGYFAVAPAMVAAGRARALAYVSLGCVALNLTVDLALVPSMGMTGAAIATLAQTVVSVIALLWVALGLKNTVRIVSGALPVAAAAGLVAFDTDSIVLAAVLAIATAATAAWGGSAHRVSLRSELDEAQLEALADARVLEPPEG